MNTGMWSCAGHVREHWQGDQFEDYGSGTGRTDKDLIWLKFKNEEREGKNLRNVAKNGITVLSDG